MTLTQQIGKSQVGGRVQISAIELSTTMNIYAHATREAKRTSARLLDKVVCGE